MLNRGSSRNRKSSKVAEVSVKVAEIAEVSVKVAEVAEVAVKGAVGGGIQDVNS